MSYTLAYPVHPGEIIREEILPRFGLNITEASKRLHTARPGFTNVCNEKSGVSPELALKIERAFGYSARRLVTMQATYDLANVQEVKGDMLSSIQRVPEVA